uniref:Ricin B lectin domain-containing protein n=1 Tax=Aplanochytrium stocchinoi TaxID=215587 RepID=A0A7S3PIE8_9STRA|eukprot:CAMPEP_0204843498 /NCGR_PEP_ID=MMETSP1346-20131115/48012_1 /ASSEMBLY_ACC=CAM_ASM_000771 /TAXON_ID=215587 /ORGANISM="Aplanochytrium stocchinoi, Strain GSBS06" /LENGTH=524 /DNA_ID=CAMNT_0051982651 /DNA_START=90 /DNA_END=1664 /DNA_ORIENTATION=-
MKAYSVHTYLLACVVCLCFSLATCYKTEYGETKICLRAAQNLCLALNDGPNGDHFVVLDVVENATRWDITVDNDFEDSIERVHMRLSDDNNFCMVKKPRDGEADGIGLTNCEDAESIFGLKPLQEKHSVERKYHYLELLKEENQRCFTAMMVDERLINYNPVTKEENLVKGAYIHLHQCFNADGCKDCDGKDIAQSFALIDYQTSAPTALPTASPTSPTTHAPSTKAPTTSPTKFSNFGNLCLKDEVTGHTDYCLGISLVDDELAGNVPIQIKSSQKNQEKDLEYLKLEWLQDQYHQWRSLANTNLCIRADWNRNVKKHKHDDALELDICGKDENEQWSLVEQEEGFYELQIKEPRTGTTKCATVINCVHRGDDRCDPGILAEAKRVNDVQLGAYVRLRDCQPERLKTQRFQWVSDQSPNTVPPVPKPTMPPPTSAPTPQPHKDHNTHKPTPEPTNIQEPQPNPNNTQEKPTSLKVGSAFLTILILFVLAIMLSVYMKTRKSYFSYVAGGERLDDDTEHFIARI